MPEPAYTSANWWTATGWLAGRCEFDSHVQSIVESTVDSAAPYMIPAPVDLHVHGGGGHDCMTGVDAIRGMLHSAGQSGTAALLATSVTAPIADIDVFLQAVESVMASPDNKAATLLGAHLEGPFINPEKLGAQPPYANEVNYQQLERWFGTGVVKVITYAPEMDSQDRVIKLCDQYSVKAQLGHSLCSCAQAQQLLHRGAGVTHLFNAMSGFSHRNGGLATAALACASYAEIITDGLHVDFAAFSAAHRAIPNLYSVTDATAATGMKDGTYKLGDLSVTKHGNSVELPDGTIAGSCLTQLRAIEVLRDWQLGWHDIALMTSYRPARWINDATVGQIATGCHAHWLEIQNDALCARWHAGVRYVL